VKPLDRVVLLCTALWLTGCGSATLEFTMVDAQSGSWVWNATARIQDRGMLEYFQSDRGPIPLRFTRLAPGASELRIDAPGYQPVRRALRLNRGLNRLPDPVRMLGLEIPGLARWLVVESHEGGDIVIQLRPVGADGKAVTNHPCLDLWVGARISVQMKDGAPAQEETEQGSTRGEELFRGHLPWRWNGTPETTFRYSARIPGALIRPSTAPWRVIDYLIVVPDPLTITAAEVDALLAGLHWEDPVEMTQALAAVRGRLRWFHDTSWNVQAETR
jgi:hypothetical protein